MARRAYTLVELLLVVLIVSAVACVAVPRLQFGAVHAVDAGTFARKLMTDLRRARAQATLNAAQNTDGYALLLLGDSPYGQYEILNLNNSTVVVLRDIPATVECTGGTRFEFGPLGNLKEGSDTQVQVAGGDRSFTITVISATGAAKCTEDL
jgi:prepilin-type N-terminal cleavage/methylation domain-containing protein